MLRKLCKRHVAAFAALGLSLALLGCSGLLGFGDYTVADPGDGSTETSTTDGSTDGGGDEEASCNVDLTLQCYACTPTTTDQFLNGCTDGQCIPFDKSRLSGLLAPDGGLPPLPPPDGG